MHLEVLRENAKDEVPFPANGDTILGGVYLRIELDLSQQDGTVEGGAVYIRGTLYVPEGVTVDRTNSPDLEVIELSGRQLATIWRQPAE